MQILTAIEVSGPITLRFKFTSRPDKFYLWLSAVIPSKNDHRALNVRLENTSLRFIDGERLHDGRQQLTTLFGFTALVCILINNDILGFKSVL